MPRSATLCHVACVNYSIVREGSPFVQKYAREIKKDVRGIARGALPILTPYDWPGNVREL